MPQLDITSIFSQIIYNVYLFLFFSFLVLIFILKTLFFEEKIDKFTYYSKKLIFFQKNNENGPLPPENYEIRTKVCNHIFSNLCEKKFEFFGLNFRTIVYFIYEIHLLILLIKPYFIQIHLIEDSHMYYGTIYVFCVILISGAYVLYANIYTFIYYSAIKNKQFLYLCKSINIIKNTDGSSSIIFEEDYQIYKNLLNSYFYMDSKSIFFRKYFLFFFEDLNLPSSSLLFFEKIEKINCILSFNKEDNNWDYTYNILLKK